MTVMIKNSQALPPMYTLSYNERHPKLCDRYDQEEPSARHEKREILNGIR